MMVVKNSAILEIITRVRTRLDQTHTKIRLNITHSHKDEDVLRSYFSTARSIGGTNPRFPSTIQAVDTSDEFRRSGKRETDEG